MQRLSLAKIGWDRRKLRLFLCALVLGLVSGLLGLGSLPEDFFRDLRAMAQRQAPSGQIVIVGIDDRSIQQIGRWPWPRRYHAELIDRLVAGGAERVLVDVDFSSPSDPVNDAALENALTRAKKKVVLPVHFSVDPGNGERVDLLPLPAFSRSAELATINVRYNYRGEVRDLPYALPIAGTSYLSFGAVISGKSGRAYEMFPIDFSINAPKIPRLSAASILDGSTDVASIRGKTVVIGTMSRQIGDMYMLPSYGLMPGVTLHALGGETLLNGRPVDIGWFLPLTAGLMALAALLSLAQGKWLGSGFAASSLTLFAVQAVLERHLILIDIMPALLALALAGSAIGWKALRSFYTGRGSRHAASGLPNLNVLREDDAEPDLPLIVAKVHNFAEIASTFDGGGQDAFVKQIAARLTLISSHAQLYQSDDGIFAWLSAEDSTNTLAALNTLYDVFRRPMLVLGTPVDVRVTFGLDYRGDNSVSSRLGSAIVAADEALRSGLKWKECDQTQLAETARKLSLMGQLDGAMANEEIWIAYQPKLEISTKRIVGAEALVRWDRAGKSQIDPMDFILAAERSGRIAELTEYVLSRALEATAKLRRAGVEFNMAVNLSALLIDSRTLCRTVDSLLGAHGVLPEQLTLEVTETAALAGHEANSKTLAGLREMGVNLAIDDYGTGLSTLDYLKRIPANEIKIDKSFIQAINQSDADRLMVQSTINLAHSLSRKVVAEGVENEATLATLAQMQCDVAQGYFVSRPLTYAQLEKLLVKRRRAA
ncbi:MAG TPA: EAL domain-containing protein [Allosphingosinicella sp.]|uniref:EAL domain-containing protein n=1 Tax=Allosphingosinicella sp. TaxID=2823234 RepID=UPI002ED97F23